MTDRSIGDNHYAHVFNILQAFKTEIIKDYLDLYLKTDVLLLACAFEHGTIIWPGITCKKIHLRNFIEFGMVLK